MALARASPGGGRTRAIAALALILPPPPSPPLRPASAFTARLAPPWTPPGSALRSDGDGDGGGPLQILADGDGAGGSRGGGGRRRRRRRAGRRRRCRTGGRTSGSSRSASVSDDGAEAEERRDPGSPPPASGTAPPSMSASGRFPDEGSTVEAYGEYAAATSAASADVASSPASSDAPKSLPSMALPSPPPDGAGGGGSAGVVSSAGARPAMGRSAAVKNGGGGGTFDPPSVKKYLGPLFGMTRPDNFPGVVLFHLVGIHKTVTQVLRTSTLSQAAAVGPRALSGLGYKSLFLQVLRDPRIVVTLGALLLSSATSMLVNDYYDARSGTDLINARTRSATAGVGEEDAMLKRKPLATGAVPLPVAKRFLYYLYAALLLSVPFVPGTAPQFSVVAGAILTFLYTQHLKPLTWYKNVLCAGVISFAPLTSGMAAATVLAPRLGAVGVGVGIGATPALASLSRLVLTLYAGFMSREILMDITDFEGDGDAGVRTVPVRYGRRFASRAALAFAAAAAALAVVGPAGRLLAAAAAAAGPAALAEGAGARTAAAALLGAHWGDAVRLLLASVSSGLMVRNAAGVCESGGRDVAAADRAVEESKVTFVALLASFL